MQFGPVVRLPKSRNKNPGAAAATRKFRDGLRGQKKVTLLATTTQKSPDEMPIKTTWWTVLRWANAA